MKIILLEKKSNISLTHIYSLSSLLSLVFLFLSPETLKKPFTLSHTQVSFLSLHLSLINKTVIFLSLYLLKKKNVCYLIYIYTIHTYILYLYILSTDKFIISYIISFLILSFVLTSGSIIFPIFIIHYLYILILISICLFHYCLC